MNVTCPECRSVFRVDPSKVPIGGVRARCSVCGGVMAVPAKEFTAATAVPAAVEHGGFDFPDAASAATAPAAGTPTPAPLPPPPPATPPRPRTPLTPPAQQVQPAVDDDFGSDAEAAPEPADDDAPEAVTPHAYRTPAPPPAVIVPRAATPVPPAKAPLRAPFNPLARPPFAPVAPAPPRPIAPASAPSGFASARGLRPPLINPVQPPVAPPVAPPQPPRAPVAPVPPAIPALIATPGVGEPVVRRPINPFLANDPNQKAKRLARALVSDMVAYLPGKREEGIRNNTLKALFREEIKKSYEEYVDQIGREVAESTTHFQDALNDVLSGGNKIF